MSYAMKKTLYIITLAMALFVMAGCKKTPKPDPVPAVVGEWQLSNIEVKSVSYAGETVDVYVAFMEEKAEDGTVVRTFELYQMVGQGRFRKYTGKWTLEGNILSGTYSSNKKPWGSDYEISVEDSTLKLTSVNTGEVDTYQKTTIPDTVKLEAYEM